MSIVITGCGVISPLGIGMEALQAGLWSGACGIGEITGGGSLSPGVEVRGFEVQRYLESEKTYLDRTSAFTLAACALARWQAAWEVSQESSERTGVILGTGFGCLETMRTYYERVLERGARLASSLLFSHSYANVPASLAAIEYHLRGHHSTVCTGLTSGATALVQAVDAIRDGRAEALFAGGVEALSETLLQGLSGYLAPGLARPGSPGPRPAGGSWGGVLGEGAGVFLLEKDSQAAARGAPARAQITGVGLARSQPLGSGDGLKRALRSALGEAQRDPEEVDVVFASANGWPEVDREEAAALRTVFPTGVPVTALKSRWGETLGAGVPLNLAAALAAFAAGKIPATILKEEGVGWALLTAGLEVVTDLRPANLRVALLTGVDFGGGCVSLVVEAL